MRSQYIQCKCSLGQLIFLASPSSKSSIWFQGIKSLEHLKSLNKNNFAFSDPTLEYLSLAGFSNMPSLKPSFRGSNINVFAQLAGPDIVRFLFLPLTWISKSLILVTNWEVSIPFSRRTSWTDCNHYSEQPSTQSEIKSVFTVSIRDTLLTSSFSLVNSICQVLIINSRSIFSFCLNTNSAMSIWPAVLRSSTIARSSW